MAHLTDGTLRRMVDDPDARLGADAAHLDGCAECKARFEGIARDAHSIATLLAVPEPRLDVTGAFHRVRSAPAAQPRLGIRLPIFAPAPRPMKLAFAAALAVFALLAVAFAANLSLFYQPKTVKTVPVTVADMQALSQLADYGTVAWSKQPNFQVATSAADASAIAGGMQAPAVTSLPAGVSTTVTYAGMSQAVATFTFSADKAAATAARHGKALPTMPRGIDGATLTVTVGPAVGEVYGNLNRQDTGAGTSANDVNLPQLIVARSASPTVTSTQVTTAQLESYILAQPGISPELKAAVNSIGDPSTTLLIPVPVQFATSTYTKVQGVDAVALGDNTGVGSGVVWVKGGSVYVVAGSIKLTDAEAIANNLK